MTTSKPLPQSQPHLHRNKQAEQISVPKEKKTLAQRKTRDFPTEQTNAGIPRARSLTNLACWAWRGMQSLALKTDRSQDPDAQSRPTADTGVSRAFRWRTVRPRNSSFPCRCQRRLFGLPAPQLHQGKEVRGLAKSDDYINFSMCLARPGSKPLLGIPVLHQQDHLGGRWSPHHGHQHREAGPPATNPQRRAPCARRVS